MTKTHEMRHTSKAGRQWRAAALALSLCALPAGLSAQTSDTDPVRLSPAEARVFAAKLGKAGQFRAMREVAKGLLRADPGDVSAWLLLSRAESELRNHPAAIRAGKRAWALADEDTERFAAAYAVAQAQNADGKLTAGQFWLRRANQYAPDDRLGRVAQTEFRKMRSRNPLQFELRFGVRPSSNINNGSKESWTPDGIDWTFEPVRGLLPLSGTEVSTGLGLSYTLKESRKARTRLSFAFDHRTYALTSEAKAIAPGVRGSDFAFTSASLKLGREQALSEKTVLKYGLGGGRLWLGGAPISDYGRVETGLTYRLSQRDAVQVQAAFDAYQGLGTRRDSDLWSLSGVWSRKMGNGDLMRLSLVGLVSQSDDVTIDYRQVQAGISYRKAQPVAGMGLEFGLTVSHRRHDVYPFSADGQSGMTGTASISATLENLDYYGFVPVVKLEARKSTSDIPLFESQGVGLSVGVRSAF